MKTNILVVTIIIGLFSSCSGTQGGKGLEGSYLGGIIHVKAVNKQQTRVSQNKQEVRINNMSAQANAQGFCSYGCKSVEPNPMTSFEFAIDNIDVDTAYLRIKREFNFRTKDEKISEKPFLKNMLASSLDFRYQSIVGVNYLMRGYKDHKYLKEETPNTIQVEISKDGQDKVFLKISFYSGNTKDIKGYKESLKSRIINSVKG